MSNSLKRIFAKRRFLLILILGMAIAFSAQFSTGKLLEATSQDTYCFSCHLHDHAEASWRMSPHVDNMGGVIVHCVDCHLPPKGHGHIPAKVKAGAKDVYGKFFKDSADYKWEAKRTPEAAIKFTYQESCIKCHSNLFPTTITVEGEDSHLYYESNSDELTCLNCHMFTGHYNPDALHAQNIDFGNVEIDREIFTSSTVINEFADFTEQIPGTSIAFDMVAIPEGEFLMGSPENEKYRDTDEGPVRNVKLDRFFMGRVEVTWDEYLAFFNATASEGRMETAAIDFDAEPVDAISGATPPWGAPDQGWGKGQRPAITMSHHAARVYCLWLTQVTGKKYRLPTEAEWEYAARGGTDTPYFFEGDPKDFSGQGFMKKIFKPDTSVISGYAVYQGNSDIKTQEPSFVSPNPFGLNNMLGNVYEFCSDWYAPDSYSQESGDLLENPKGPESGKEHVIRGGSFGSDASDLRSAARDYTRTVDWLKTDPQLPKSIWWYSDSKEVGFRVVCEAGPEL